MPRRDLWSHRAVADTASVVIRQRLGRTDGGVLRERDGDELRGTGDLRWVFRRDRGIPAQAPMGSGNVLVLLDELPQQSLRVSLAWHDCVVE